MKYNIHKGVVHHKTDIIIVALSLFIGAVLGYAAINSVADHPCYRMDSVDGTPRVGCK